MYPTVTLPSMLKIAEAAKAFKVGAGTIRQAVQTGRLRGYTPNGHTLLVKAVEVQAWIECCEYSTRLERGAQTC